MEAAAVSVECSAAIMDGDVTCGKCKQSLGRLTSVGTQTTDFDSTIESAEGNANALQTDCEQSEKSIFEAQVNEKGILGLEDISISEDCQTGVSSDADEVVDFAVFQNVTDEAFEMDPTIEIGTAAEMHHGSDKIVVLTRSFECSSDAVKRWKMVANAAKAANHFHLTRKERTSEQEDVESILTEADDNNTFSGFRRIIISNERLAITRQRSGTFGKDGSSHCQTENDADEDSKKRNRPSAAMKIKCDGRKNMNGLIEESAAEKCNDTSKDRLRRASSVLGPNRKCLQLQEQDENIEPGQDVKLPEEDGTAYNVTVVTRCFESGPSSASEELTRERWKRVRDATRISKAMNRLRRSKRHQEGDSGELLRENGDFTTGPFVGSGYRRVSMKTVDEFAHLSRKRSRFRRNKSAKF